MVWSKVFLIAALINVSFVHADNLIISYKLISNGIEIKLQIKESVFTGFSRPDGASACGTPIRKQILTYEYNGAASTTIIATCSNWSEASSEVSNSSCIENTVLPHSIPPVMQ